MADEIISISTAVWERKLAEYMARFNISMREALYEEWPLLMRKVMDFTPPFKTKGARGMSDLSVGRGAVACDIYKTMRPFNPAAKSKNLERILDRNDHAAFNVLASRSTNPLMRNLKALPFSPELHLQARNARGRVPGKYRKIVVLGSDAGLLKAYVKKIQGRVGYAKSGWLKALALVGGEAPGYVENKGMGGGDVIDDHANDDYPSITAINRTPWAVRRDEGERIKADAYASRIEAIVSKIRTKERLAREAAGLKAA